MRLPLLTLILCAIIPVTYAASPMPERGQSMRSVLKHYGEPQQRLPPVGNPPITRWIYPEFTVYFEYHHTIHSVRHRPQRTPSLTSTSR